MSLLKGRGQPLNYFEFGGITNTYILPSPEQIYTLAAHPRKRVGWLDIRLPISSLHFQKGNYFRRISVMNFYWRVIIIVCHESVYLSLS